MAAKPLPLADEESHTQLVDWAATKGKPKRAKTIGDAPWERALREARAMMQTAVWAGANARHYAAAYELLHARVYGVAPAEMNPAGRMRATWLAAKMLRDHFDGDVMEMASFVRWAWAREVERERWRRENGREGARITVGFMFGGALVTDYRVAMARKRCRSSCSSL